MLLRLIIIFFGIFFLFSKSTWAGDCDIIISIATTSQLSCADDDFLTVEGPDGSITFDNEPRDMLNMIVKWNSWLHELTRAKPLVDIERIKL